MDESQGLFTPELAEDIASLTQLGYLYDEFEWCGYRFGIRTLKIDEELAAARLVKIDEGTQALMKATTTTVAAACLESINGIPFMPALERDYDVYDYIKLKYKEFAKKYHWPVAQIIGMRYTELMTRQYELLADLEKKFLAGETSSTDLFAPLTSKDYSEEDLTDTNTDA